MKQRYCEGLSAAFLDGGRVNTDCADDPWLTAQPLPRSRGCVSVGHTTVLGEFALLPFSARCAGVTGISHNTFFSPLWSPAFFLFCVNCVPLRICRCLLISIQPRRWREPKSSARFFLQPGVVASSAPRSPEPPGSEWDASPSRVTQLYHKLST